MSDFSVPKFVLGAGALAFGIATGNPNLIIIGGVGIAGATGLFGAGMSSGAAGFEANTISPTNDIPRIYGKRRVGLRVVDYRVDPSDDEDLFTVGALCRGSRNGLGVNDVVELFFDGEHLADSSGAPQGVYQAVTFGFSAAARAPFYYAIHYGSVTQSASGTLTSKFATEWPSTSQGRGICWVEIETDYRPEVHRSKPEYMGVVEGCLCYDPRDGTYKYTTNPALIALDYMLDPIDGPGFDISEFDLASVQALADAAETQIDIPDGMGGTTQVDQWACNIVLDTSKTWQENILQIRSSFPGWIYKEGNLWRFAYRSVKSAVSYTLDDDTIVGDFGFREKGPKDGINSVDVSFIDEDDNWQAGNLRYPDDVDGGNTYVDDDGIESPFALELPGETNRYRALVRAASTLAEVRDAIVIQCTARESALQLQVGDVVPVDHSALGSLGPLDCWVWAMEPLQNGLVRLVLISYNEDAYTTPTLSDISDAPSAGLPSAAPVSDPTGFALSAVLSCLSPLQAVATVTATWTNASVFLDRTLIRYREDPSGEWIYPAPALGDAESAVFQILVTQADYDVELNARSLAGGYSSPLDDANWGVTDTISLDDGSIRTDPPDASEIAGGDVSVTNVSGAVQLDVDTTNSNGTVFDLHVSSSASFTASDANLVQTRVAALDATITFLFTPPVAAGATFYYKIVVRDCASDALGDEDTTSEFSATYTGPTGLTGPFTYNDVGNVSSTQDIDWSDGWMQTITLTGDTVLTFSNYSAGMRLELFIEQDSTGGWSVTFPDGMYWDGGSVPVISSNAGTFDLVTFSATSGSLGGIFARYEGQDFGAVSTGGGLLWRDNFPYSSSTLDYAYDSLADSDATANSNQARLTLPGASNDCRHGWDGDTAIDEVFVQIDVTDHGGDSMNNNVFGKWVEATGGYMIQVASFANELKLRKWDSSSFSDIDTDAQDWDATETGYLQLYLADGVQEGFARNSTDATTASVSASDTTYQHAGYAGFGFGVGNSPVGDAHSDNLIIMGSKNIVVSGMSSGYKAKVRNSGASVVASATESGSGSVTVDCSEYGGATEKVPYDGWEDLVITDGSDNIVKTISGPIYPGQSFTGA